jgi:hypothetical protein
MRHASGTCTTIGIIKDIDDVFVSGVGEARAWAAPGEEASRDARWGRHAQAAHYGACHARPGQQGPMKGHTYVVSGRGAP